MAKKATNFTQKLSERILALYTFCSRKKLQQPKINYFFDFILQLNLIDLRNTIIDISFQKKSKEEILHSLTWKLTSTYTVLFIKIT